MSRGGVAAAGAAVVALCGSYLAWKDDGETTASASAAAIGGASLFRAKGCATCHTGPDTVSQFGNEFPSLRNAGEWAGTRKPGMPAKDYLTESMLLPGAFTSPAFNGAVGPTASMPVLPLTEEEADALVAYLLRS